MYEAEVERDCRNDLMRAAILYFSEEQGYSLKVIFRIFEARMEFIISLINIHLRK